MASVDRATIRELALTYADVKSSPGRRNGAFPPEKVDPLINLSMAEHYDDLVAARGHEYFEVEDASASTASGVAVYALPAKFYELLSLHLLWPDGKLEEVRALDNVGDRGRYANWGQWGQWDLKAYRLRGPQVELFPTPSTAAAKLVVRYVPEFTPFTADTGAAGSFVFVNGWERVVALRVALEILTIQQLPFGNLQSLYQQDRQRVSEMAADRTVSAPARVRDVHPEGYDDRFWWPRGRAT